MRVSLLLLALVVTSACGDARVNYGDQAQYQALDAASHYMLARSSVSDRYAGAGFAFRAADSLAPISRSVPVPGAMLIRNGNASIAVRSLDAALRTLDSIARDLGGTISRSQQALGGARSGFVTLRIPSARLDEAIAQLKAIGDLEGVSVGSDDVGEEFVDITARLDNARRLERRLLELLANRAGGIADVLQVEQALARARTEVEGIEGRRRYLERRVAMSSLEVRLHEPYPVIGERFASVINGAVAQAGRNFVSLVAFGVSALGVILPLIVVAVPLWIVWKRRRRGVVATRPA